MIMCVRTVNYCAATSVRDGPLYSSRPQVPAFHADNYEALVVSWLHFFLCLRSHPLPCRLCSCPLQIVVLVVGPHKLYDVYLAPLNMKLNNILSIFEMAT